VRAGTVPLQVFQVLRKPGYGLAAGAIALLFGVMLAYFSEFLFFFPYVVFYVPPEELVTFGLDFSISILSGVVITASIYGIRNLRKGGSQAKGGVAGIIVALVAGACPCYYLVPLLAVAGGAGGVLGVLGIYMNAYQLPIKLLSLALLGSVAFSLERSLRASCEIRAGPGRHNHVLGNQPSV
jgi:hypothetical protein